MIVGLRWFSHTPLLSPVARFLDRIVSCQGNARSRERSRSTLPQSASNPCSTASATAAAASARALARVGVVHLRRLYSTSASAALPTSIGDALRLARGCQLFSCEESRLRHIVTSHDTTGQN